MGMSVKGSQRSRAAARKSLLCQADQVAIWSVEGVSHLFRTVAKQCLQDRHHKAATALVGILPIFVVLLLGRWLLPSPLLLLLLGRSCSSRSIRASRRLVRGLLPITRLVGLWGGTRQAVPWHLLADRGRLIHLSAIPPSNPLEHLRDAHASQQLVLLQRAKPAQ